MRRNATTTEAMGDPWYDAESLTEDTDDYIGAEEAEHIASWHPAVALAVADWLEGVGERHVPMGHPMYGVLCCATCNLDLEDDERGHCDDLADALAVAHAYLGSDQ